jgi:hypothetical protein
MCRWRSETGPTTGGLVAGAVGDHGVESSQAHGGAGGGGMAKQARLQGAAEMA